MLNFGCSENIHTSFSFQLKAGLSIGFEFRILLLFEINAFKESINDFADGKKLYHTLSEIGKFFMKGDIFGIVPFRILV